MKVNYVVEPSQRCPGYNWVAAYDETGEMICTPVSWLNAEEVKEIYEKFDAMRGQKRRKLLIELDFAPYVIEACSREVLDYIFDRGLCAAQVVRAAHEKTKLTMKIYGAMPDLIRRTDMVLLDRKSKAEREAYLENVRANWEENCHPAQRLIFRNWVDGKICGGECFDEVLRHEATLRMIMGAV